MDKLQSFNDNNKCNSKCINHYKLIEHLRLSLLSYTDEKMALRLKERAESEIMNIVITNAVDTSEANSPTPRSVSKSYRVGITSACHSH
jgi:hypothetical protein